MQINNNREMRALEDLRERLKRESAATEYLYAEAVKGFHLCPSRPMGQMWCPVECGQCNGTGWVKK